MGSTHGFDRRVILNIELGSQTGCIVSFFSDYDALSCGFLIEYTKTDWRELENNVRVRELCHALTSPACVISLLLVSRC